MELNPVNGFGMTAPTTVDVSPESLRSLVRQIEAELYCSEVYNIPFTNMHIESQSSKIIKLNLKL